MHWTPKQGATSARPKHTEFSTCQQALVPSSHSHTPSSPAAAAAAGTYPNMHSISARSLLAYWGSSRFSKGTPRAAAASCSVCSCCRPRTVARALLSAEREPMRLARQFFTPASSSTERTEPPAMHLHRRMRGQSFPQGPPNSQRRAEIGCAPQINITDG